MEMTTDFALLYKCGDITASHCTGTSHPFLSVQPNHTRGSMNESDMNFQLVNRDV